MRVERGATQILFGFLPGQTVDLNGGIWRIAKWNEPKPLAIDQAALRRALLEQVGPWRMDGRNDGIWDELQGGLTVEAVKLNETEGILAEAFPPIWRCRSCSRLLPRATGKCGCGSESRHQLHYVQFHACGLIEEPTLPRCTVHKQVAMRLPGSAAVRDLTFHCPVCQKSLGRGGFPFRNCQCGIQPLRLERNVHRAASVFTPRFVSIVNPADPATSARLRAAGGGAKALEWVLAGMVGDQPMGGPQTVSGLMDTLIRSGIPPGTAQELARVALERGAVAESTTDEQVQLVNASAAQDEAFSLAAAVSEGRVSIADLCSRAGPPLQTLYQAAYEPAIARARLESVDLLPRFPVATLAFGYTRGDPTPGASRLNAFRERGAPRVYGTLQQTEGLLFRLDPLSVHSWLLGLGEASGPAAADRREARIALLRILEIPRATDQNATGAGRVVVELLHSYAHRAIRRLAAFAGIEREGLSEYLLPHHLGFIVYAASRGFVLGGLQAVFETTLHRFLADLLEGESRCPLDPGCRNGGAACMACLHLGEASCRWFNRFLDRTRLFGPEGFLR